MTTAYISIGNSDDNLTQREWSRFVRDVRDKLRQHATAIHGEWYSASDDGFQNACFCAELREQKTELVKSLLAGFANVYRQDSIAWAVVPQTEFIKP